MESNHNHLWFFTHVNKGMEEERHVHIRLLMQLVMNSVIQNILKPIYGYRFWVVVKYWRH